VHAGEEAAGARGAALHRVRGREAVAHRLGAVAEAEEIDVERARVERDDTEGCGDDAAHDVTHVPSPLFLVSATPRAVAAGRTLGRGGRVLHPADMGLATRSGRTVEPPPGSGAAQR